MQIQVRALTFIGCVIACHSSHAFPTKLDVLSSGTQGTVVFIHGMSNCSNPGGTHPLQLGQIYSDTNTCLNDPSGYWRDLSMLGGDNHSMTDEASRQQQPDGTWKYWEAIGLRHEAVDQGFQSDTGEVAACLADLVAGTNTTGCNPSLLKRTSFHIVGHSEGGAVIDRILSTNWWPQVSAAIVGYPVALSAALAGSRGASAFYGVDGASNLCVQALGSAMYPIIAAPIAQSLTRGSIIGEANNGKAGKSPVWIAKVPTTGSQRSHWFFEPPDNANNFYYDQTGGPLQGQVDFGCGVFAACVGEDPGDASDGFIWQHDSDPTASPSTSNGGAYQAAYTGYYWHWFGSWGNHVHTNTDPYAKKYGIQTMSGCQAISPGTCIGQYALTAVNSTSASSSSSSTTNTNATARGVIASQGSCVDLQGGSSSWGTSSLMNPCSGASSQTWKLSGYSLVSSPYGTCLDLACGSTADGTAVQEQGCNSFSSSQAWHFNNAAILGGQSGKCLDVPNGNWSNGQTVQIWDCTGSTNQQWTYDPVLMTLKGLNNKCLDLTNGNSSNGTRLQVWDCNGGPNQAWVQGRGGFVHKYAGKCADVTNQSTANGASVQIWDCWDGANQKWAIQGPLTSMGGKCLDLDNGNQQLQIRTCNGTLSQKFTAWSPN